MARSVNDSRRRRAGFTLIELLVVLSLIALLVAMMLPALASAREAGRSVTCLSNLRQVMLANHVYANDFRGYLVPAKGGNRYQPERYWFKVLVSNDYFGGGGLICNSETVPSDWSTVLGDWKAMTGSQENLPVSYGYAAVLGNHHTVLAFGGNWSLLALPKQIDEFTGRHGPHSTPTQAFVVFDYASEDNASGSFAENAKVGGDLRFGMDRVSARHGGGADVRGAHVPMQGAGNFGFVDGHAQTLQAPYSVDMYVPNPEFASHYRAAGGFTDTLGGF